MKKSEVKKSNLVGLSLEVTNTNMNTNNLLPQPHSYSQMHYKACFSHIHIVTLNKFWLSIMSNSSCEFGGDLGKYTIINGSMD